jgi:hypothetical protein
VAASSVWCVIIFRTGPFAVVAAWTALKSCWKQRYFALKRSPASFVVRHSDFAKRHLMQSGISALAPTAVAFTDFVSE